MTDVLTPEIVQQGMIIVARLTNTADDFQEVVEGELEIGVTGVLGRYVDSKIMPCECCDYWSPVGEIRAGYCYACFSDNTEE